jgi:hypothetical protein
MKNEEVSQKQSCQMLTVDGEQDFTGLNWLYLVDTTKEFIVISMSASG